MSEPEIEDLLRLLAHLQDHHDLIIAYLRGLILKGSDPQSAPAAEEASRDRDR